MESQELMKCFPIKGIAALAIGIALALSGCSSRSTDASPTAGASVSADREASPTAVASVAASKGVEPETAAWVEYVRNRATTLGSKTDASLVATAEGICDELSGGKMFEEVVHDVSSKVLPKAQEKDQILLLGTGIARFCPEHQRASTGDSTADFLARIRESAPSLAHNTDEAILSQARTTCPNASEGPAGGARVVSVSRKAWGDVEGYRFAFLAVTQFCSSAALSNIAVNK